MLKRRSLLLAAGSLAGCASAGASSDSGAHHRRGPLRNQLTLHDASGDGARDHPMRIGRPFREGEIMHAPQAMIGTTPLPTQADIKQRWPDGSVKHALLSFIVPQNSA